MTWTILVVCRGSTCRSPMLQCLLQERLNTRWDQDIALVRDVGDAIAVDPVLAKVESAGTLKEAAGKPAAEHSITCMQKRGLDLSSHRSRWIGDLDLTVFDLFLCVGPDEAAALVERGVPRDKIEIVNEAQGGIPNPYQKGLGEYQACARVIEQFVEDFVANIASRF